MDFSDEETIRKMARIFYVEIEKIQYERAAQSRAQTPPSPEYTPPKRLRVEVLADKHTDWLMMLLRSVYHDAFVHGYKHGMKDIKMKKEGEVDD